MFLEQHTPQYNECMDHQNFDGPYTHYTEEYAVLKTIQCHRILDIKIQKTVPGQGYHAWHCESTMHENRFRLCAFMLYLNDVEEGGETYFKHLNLKIKPKKGLLIGWNNLYKNGFPNYKTMHEALPPLIKSKYIITKWWRSWSLI